MQSKSKFFLFIYGLTWIVFILTVYSHSIFLSYIETRQGFVLNDPVLENLPPTNCAIFIFMLTYGAILIGIVHFSQNAIRWFGLMLAFIFILLLRAITLALVPLEPPMDIIPLRDMILEHSTYRGNINVKDLFFSGHTSNICVLGMLTEHIHLKKILLSMAIIVAILLLIQHVHYTIDVLAAPFFAYAATRTAIRVRDKIMIFLKMKAHNDETLEYK